MMSLDSVSAERLTRRVAASAKTATVPAPFTGQRLVELPVTAGEDVRAAYEKAGAAQREWAGRPVRERARPFLRLTGAPQVPPRK
jgi:succinate-semialdehyde dehydrogenase / glutarate-semialdehyde dehydrogenase